VSIALTESPRLSSSSVVELLNLPWTSSAPLHGTVVCDNLRLWRLCKAFVLWRTTSVPLRSVSCETVAVLRNSRFLALGRTTSASFRAIFSQNSCFPWADTRASLFHGRPGPCLHLPLRELLASSERTSELHSSVDDLVLSWRFHSLGNLHHCQRAFVLELSAGGLSLS
jgi:hypothetical protein